MKEVELTILMQTDTIYEKAVHALNEKYKGAWDDDIHDSFHLLLTQTNENQSRIHSGVNEAIEIYNAAKDLNVDGLCQTAESLCREVESL